MALPRHQLQWPQSSSTTWMRQSAARLPGRPRSWSAANLPVVARINIRPLRIPQMPLVLQELRQPLSGWEAGLGSRSPAVVLSWSVRSACLLLAVWGRGSVRSVTAPFGGTTWLGCKAKVVVVPTFKHSPYGSLSHEPSDSSNSGTKVETEETALETSPNDDWRNVTVTTRTGHGCTNDHTSNASRTVRTMGEPQDNGTPPNDLRTTLNACWRGSVPRQGLLGP